MITIKDIMNVMMISNYNVKLMYKMYKIYEFYEKYDTINLR